MFFPGHKNINHYDLFEIEATTSLEAAVHEGTEHIKHL